MYVESLVVEVFPSDTVAGEKVWRRPHFLQEIDGSWNAPSNDLNYRIRGPAAYLRVNYTDDVAKAASGFTFHCKDSAWPIFGLDYSKGTSGDGEDKFRYITTNKPGDFAIKKGDIHLWTSKNNLEGSGGNPTSRGYDFRTSDMNKHRPGKNGWLYLCWKQTSTTLELVSITLGTFISKGQEPKVVHETVIDNSSSVAELESQQTWSFTSSTQKSVTVEAGFKFTSSATVEASTGALIPGGSVSGTVGFELSVNVSGTFSTTSSKEETSQATIKVPAGARVKFTALIFSTLGEVPFTMHFTNGSTRKGVWKGVVNSKNTYKVANISSL